MRLAPPLSSNSHVHEYPNITAAYNAVIAQTDPVGFVAMSAICLNGKYPTSGTSALAYFPVQASPEDPSMLVNGYNPLTQAGIPIRQRRSQAQNDELASFVAFLTDFTSPPTPDSPMTATLRKYCYSAGRGAASLAPPRIERQPQPQILAVRARVRSA